MNKTTNGFDFTSKVAIITGAGQGMGKTTAKAFAEAGANVVLTDISDSVIEVAEELSRSGAQARSLVADISKPETSKELVALALDSFGRLDIAFNNAGVGGQHGSVAEVPDEDWTRVISINLSSVFYCIREEVRAMVKTGGGVIINNASVTGVNSVAGAGVAYTTSKHGVIGLTKQVAVNNGPDGIRCNAVCPGFIETAMIKGAGHDPDAFLKKIPLGRLGQSEDIASVVLSLCSDHASYINGGVIVVDGGITLT